jgi:hypothetical protein
MPQPYRANIPVPVPLALMPPRRGRRAIDTLEVVFAKTGDLIRIHSYATRCSAAWSAARTHGYLESERGDGTTVPILPDERAWLDGIHNLTVEWQMAVEAADRSWIAWVANRIQRYDDHSDGLIDLVVERPPMSAVLAA